MTETAPPLRVVFKDGAFHPASTAAELRAKRFYAEGREYELAEYHPRSSRSHAHFFACVEDAFRNLPEVYAQEFGSAEQLRKWALVRTGFCKRDELVCDTPQAAERVAGFMRGADEYAVIQVDGNVVRRFTAKSQRMNVMDRDEFQRSKEAVLDFLSTIIGTTRAALERNAATAA